MASAKLLGDLPEELLTDIVERLDQPGLLSLSLVSRWCYELTPPVIWREVQLVDCSTNTLDGVDEHDDTPLLKKLLALAKNPKIASCVQIVTYQCHLPPPAIFNELPRTPFSGVTLSPDPRTSKLVQLAVQHMTRVHTLRIIFGHPNINDALLRCFFAKDRQPITPVRRLWLENCRISAGCHLHLSEHPLNLPLRLDFSGLESVRFRRLPIRPGRPTTKHIPRNQFVHARGMSTLLNEGLQDGAGGVYMASMNDLKAEINWVAREDTVSLAAYNGVEHQLEALFDRAQQFDDRIYESLAQITDLPIELNNAHIPSHYQRTKVAYRGPWLDPADLHVEKGNYVMWKAQRERLPSADIALGLLNSACHTLTSLCLDWVLTSPKYYGNAPWKTTTPDSDGWISWISMFLNLFDLRFPHLRALQFRNAVVRDTLQPPGFYLLDHAHIQIKEGPNVTAKLREHFRSRLDLACLEFMEAHSKLQVLAWPMENFFSDKASKCGITNRVNTVIDNLGRTLVDLRVDTLYKGAGERQSDPPGSLNRERRRRFISEFASKMTKVESIKIEGGVPRDERREVIRALNGCPLKKIVMIGVCSSVGNTWGTEGRDLGERLSRAELEPLEGENKDTIFSYQLKEPVAPPTVSKFEPTYGWPPGPPMIHTIAAYHADTVTELKFCGYKGAPMLFNPTAITPPMLNALRYFHKLESLIMSMWLSTVSEDASRDSELISYWLDARSPSSTALVRTVMDEEPEGWEKELRTKFAPEALAWYITSFIGPFLSEQAKARKGGVHVRASMCIGDWGGIFDIDLHIGKGSMNSDVCLGYVGPREELERERRRSKLENRRWF